MSTTQRQTPRIDVRPGGDRLLSRLPSLESKHSFSVSGHTYDPENTHHGVLLVHNEDTVVPGAGFETHPHHDMEIITWVLEGSLVHQDSTGGQRISSAEPAEILVWEMHATIVR